MESAGSAADLYSGERRIAGTTAAGCGGEATAEEESNGADEEVLDATDGVDLDGYGGGIGCDELRGDTEDEFLVPGRVFAADSVGTSAEFSGGVDVSECVGLHTAQVSGGSFEALSRDQVDLENLSSCFHATDFLLLLLSRT